MTRADHFCYLCRRMSQVRAVHIVPKDRFAVVRCTSCGLVFCVSWPIAHPSHLQLAQSPQSSEESSYWNEESITREIELPAYIRDELHHYLELLGRYLPPGKLLDVGCSFGAFVKMARESNWDARGIDVSPQAIQYGAEKWGLPLSVADLQDPRLPVRYFDVITLLDVIEHQLDPVPFLQGVVRLLRPGGYLLIETPNHDCLYNDLYGLYNSTNNLVARLTRNRVNRPLRIYYAYDHSSVFQQGHVLHFVVPTLEKLVSLFGFETVHIEKQFSDIRYILARQTKNRMRQFFMYSASVLAHLFRKPNKLIGLFKLSNGGNPSTS